MCCDLTRPVTGGTVNIRLSCDSHRSLEEPTKGQCFLMPLPTTKLSDFISCSCICPILGDGYIGGVASLCAHTAMVILMCMANIHAKACTATHTHTQWARYTGSCARRCMQIHVYLHTNQRACGTYAQPLASSSCMSCLTVTAAN